MTSLFVATPMYAGQCYGAYADSMMKLCAAFAVKGIPFKFDCIFNESHIDRARTVLADEFLLSGMSHLLFVDSDISGFTPENIFELIEYDKDIICGFYPKKRINWKHVVEAVKAGFADDDPEALGRFVGDMVFTPALNDDSNRYRTTRELVLLHEGGTGFMLIQRRALLKIAEANPELSVPRHIEHPRRMTVFFDAKICPDKYPVERILTEDFDFCRLARNAGIDIWLAPWIRLDHHGYYRFIGDIEALAATRQPKPEMAEAAE